MKSLLLIPKAVYSVWAYFWAIWVFFFGALGYAIVNLLVRKRPERSMLRVNNVLVTLWGLVTGIRYKLILPKGFDWKRPAVYVVNHTSTLDMFIASYSFRMGLRFLVKKELRKVPMLGFMFSQIAVFVDRKSPDGRKEALAEMKSLAAQGVSLCVFPEGTRNRTGELLGKFYDGAFTMAIHAGVPVVPLVLTGGPQIMPMKSWMLKPGILHAEYLDATSTAGLTMDDVASLKDSVRNQMLSHLKAR